MAGIQRSSQEAPMSRFIASSLVAGTLLAPALCLAAAPADPAEAKAQVAPIQHRSSLQRFQRQAEAPPIPWRQANDTVARIGGWRAYAREAQSQEPAASAPRRQP
jgi:hypothetical protein